MMYVNNVYSHIFYLYSSSWVFLIMFCLNVILVFISCKIWQKFNICFQYIKEFCNWLMNKKKGEKHRKEEKRK
jgi:hypothetical protein